MNWASVLRLASCVVFALSAFGFAIFAGDSWFGLQLGLALWVGAEPVGAIVTTGGKVLSQIGKAAQ